MLTLFALSLPGLVVLIIALSSFKLLRAKLSGKPRPGSASIGIDMLDVLLKPGSEHRIMEEEKRLIIREDAESADPPFSKIEIDGQKLSWKDPKMNTVPKDS